MEAFKVYQDRTTGKWKWGKRGDAIYDTKEQASRAGMDILLDRLRRIKDQLEGTISSHGK